MAWKDRSAKRLTAVQLIRQTLGDTKLTPSSLELLTVAVEQDLVALAVHAADDERRLVRVETQTQLLGEAVIALARTGTSDAAQTSLALAVQAVKDTLSTDTP